MRSAGQIEKDICSSSRAAIATAARLDVTRALRDLARERKKAAAAECDWTCKTCHELVAAALWNAANRLEKLIREAGE